MIVVDTNIIAYFYLTGEKDPVWAAPFLCRSEFRNVLSVYLRKKILSYQDILSITDLAETMMSGNEYTVSSENVFQLVKSSNCSAYDCEFVSLAQELKVPLVTADNKILKEFTRYCLPLSSFLTH